MLVEKLLILTIILTFENQSNRSCRLLVFYWIFSTWCPRQELNLDLTFRKRELYPFELRGRAGRAARQRKRFTQRPGFVAEIQNAPPTSSLRRLPVALLG